MAKKKVKTKTPGEVIAEFAIPLSELAGLRMPRPTGSLLQRTVAKLSRNSRLGIVRSSQRVSPCCRTHDRRDGLIVVSYDMDATRDALAAGIPNTDRSVTIFAIDEHDGHGVNLTMDVESMERHVNNVTEVLAYVRRRNEEMAAAAAGGNA